MCMRVHATHLVILEIAEGPLHGVPFLNVGSARRTVSQREKWYLCGTISQRSCGRLPTRPPRCLKTRMRLGPFSGGSRLPSENDPSYLLDLSHLGGPAGGSRAAPVRMICDACIDWWGLGVRPNQTVVERLRENLADFKRNISQKSRILYQDVT